MSSTSSRIRLDAELTALFGSETDWRRETGLLQVTAIDARGRSVIAIGPGAPASATDRFVLGFARARADAIITTGAILRAERDLVHRFSDERREDEAWWGWRADQLGRREAPCLLILSLRGEIPFDHPALAGSARAIVWTSQAGQARLGRAGGRFEVRVGIAGGSQETLPHACGPEHPSAAEALSDAYHWLRDEVGAETVAIESGPGATLGLYEAAGGDSAKIALAASSSPRIARVDELLLSVYAGIAPTPVSGPAFPPTEHLAAYFSGTEQPGTRVRVEEPSGAWFFERYRRAPER